MSLWIFRISPRLPCFDIVSMCKDWLRKLATINAKKKGQVEKIRIKQVVRVRIKVFKNFQTTYWKNQQQSNRGDMRKIPVTRQFFEGSGPKGHFSKKKTFKISSRRVCVPNFRSVSFFVWPGGPVQTDKPTYLQVKIGISSTGCSPHVDFDLKKN